VDSLARALELEHHYKLLDGFLDTELLYVLGELLLLDLCEVKQILDEEQQKP